MLRFARSGADGSPTSLGVLARGAAGEAAVAITALLTAEGRLEAKATAKERPDHGEAPGAVAEVVATAYDWLRRKR